MQFGSFTSYQVNVDPSGANIPGDAANEPSLAIDPTNPDVIVAGWRQFDTVASNFRQAGWAASSDGGSTWPLSGVHEPGVFRSDPVLGADLDGNIHYYSLTLTGQSEFSCQLFTTSNGGGIWSSPVPAFGGDKAWMTVDRTATAGAGNVYAKWQTFFGCCGSSTFIRSTDGGQSFQSRIEVPGGPSFGTIAVGPDGEVYAAGIEMIDFQNYDKFVIARSSNAWNPNQTPVFEWDTEVILGGSMVIGEGPNPAGLLGQAGVAVDHSSGPTRGFVYVLCSVDPPGLDPLDVMLARSEDSGVTWSEPVRINDDAGDAWQWFGTLAVAPDGRLDVVWNDTRDNPDNLSATHYAYSLDTGLTWSPNIQIGPVFDSHAGWPQQDKIGDYYDMISDGAAANLIYATTYNGEQDVWFARLGDCNGNGVHDGLDLAAGVSSDLNANGVLDSCEGICSQLADCADLDANGIRDDPCVWWECVASACQGVDITFADLGGANGACPPDGTADGNDRFHALNCFSNVNTLGQPGYPCEDNPPAALNVDAVGRFGVCAPDGVCDGNDAFAALNAFEGRATCTCPP